MTQGHRRRRAGSALVQGPGDPRGLLAATSSLCLFPLRPLHGDVRAEVLRLEAAVSLSIATGTALLPQPRWWPALGSAVGGRRCHSDRTAQCRLIKGPGGAICGLPLPTCDGAVG